MIKYIGERQGGAERSNGKLTRFKTLLYSIGKGDNPGDILLDTNIPADGVPHPDYSGFVCTGVSSPQRSSGNEVEGAFTVQVNYSNNASDIPTDKSNDGNPPWEQKAYNIFFGDRDVIVPQTKAYQAGDTQFKPSKPVCHPATKEPLISDTIESHGIIGFTYALKKWDYRWQQIYRNTTNLDSIIILGYTFSPKMLLLRKLSAIRKNYTYSTGKTSPYWEISVEIEDFGHTIIKQLALQGYYCITGGKQRPIQLSNSVFGFFDERRTDLNITTPRWVAKDGTVLASGASVNPALHYDDFPDIFERNWKALGFPIKEV